MNLRGIQIQLSRCYSKLQGGNKLDLAQIALLVTCYSTISRILMIRSNCVLYYAYILVCTTAVGCTYSLLTINAHFVGCNLCTTDNSQI